MVKYLPLAFVLAISGFIVFRWAYLRYANKYARLGLLAAALILSLPSVWFLGNYIYEIPSGAWFFRFHSLPMIEALSGLVGALAGVVFAFTKLHPKRYNVPAMIAVTILAAMLLLAPFGKQLLYTKVDYASLKDTWNNGICRQTSGTTCMPASFATVIRMLGGDITEKQLAREAGTNRGGTEVWYMIRVLRKHGYRVDIRTTRRLKDASVPSVIGLGTMGHVVVMISKTKYGPEIGDPLGYRKKYSWKEFEESYKPEQVYFAVRPID